MDFLITIADELLPGVIANSYAENKQPEQIVQDYATALCTKICMDLKVGPYYTGPIAPQWNQDGTPFTES